MTVLDEDGRELKNGRVLSFRRYVEEFLQPVPTVRGGIGSGRSSYVMADLLRELDGRRLAWHDGQKPRVLQENVNSCSI